MTKGIRKIIGMVIFLSIFPVLIMFAQDWFIDTVVGGSIGDGKDALESSLSKPHDVCVADNGDIYVVDGGHHRIRRVKGSNNKIETYIGNPLGSTHFPDGTSIDDVHISQPISVCLDPYGWLYVIAGERSMIFKVNLSSGLIYHFASEGGRDKPADGIDPKTAGISYDFGNIFSDHIGNIYFTSKQSNWTEMGGLFQVKRTDGKLYILTGFGSTAPVSGIKAKDVNVNPRSANIDSQGNIIFIDGSTDIVWRIDPEGWLWHVAGNPNGIEAKNIINPVQATNVRFGQWLNAVECDSVGNIYLNELGKVFKIDSLGMLTVIAGKNPPGFSGDGGPALNAQIGHQYGMFIDNSDDILICDGGSERIRKIFMSNPIPIIDTVIGGNIGDGNNALDCSLSKPNDIWIASDGDMFIVDGLHHRIRHVESDTNIIDSIAGDPMRSQEFPDGSLAREVNISQPISVCVDPYGWMYVIAGERSKIYRVDLSTNEIYHFAGEGGTGKPFDGANPKSTEISYDFGNIFSDTEGNIYVSSKQSNWPERGGLFKIAKDDGYLYILTGFGSLPLSDGILATQVSVNPKYACMDPFGNIFFIDSMTETVWKIELSQDGILRHVAGDPNGIEVKDIQGNVPAVNVRFGQWLTSLACDSKGNLYLTELGQVLKIDSSGNLQRIAGMIPWGYSGDGGPALNARIGEIYGMSFDHDDNLYICDGGSNRIRKIFTINNPPVAKCKDIEIQAEPGECVANGSIDDDSYDPDGDSLTFNQIPPGPYPIGTTEVTLIVSDGDYEDSCTGEVLVFEKVPPSGDVKASPDILWPPNNKMKDIHVAVTAEDNCDPSPAIKLERIDCNEELDPDDIQGAEYGSADFDFQLKAKRDPAGQGREYEIVYSLQDQCGNVSFIRTFVKVPHDQKKKK